MDKKADIVRALRSIETAHNVKALFACESGSRIYGLDSHDSDYDVRFIYVNSASWYLSVRTKKKDTIEKTVGEIDMAGWDLRKAFALFADGNVQLMEWLCSPVVYMSPAVYNGRSLADVLRELMDDYYSIKRAVFHYLHMGLGTYKKYIKGRDVVVRKKYLCLVRPLFSVLWLDERGQIPPLDFWALATGVSVSDDVRGEALSLAKTKREEGEFGIGERIGVIDRFAERMFDEYDGSDYPDARARDVRRLDELFMSTVLGIYGRGEYIDREEYEKRIARHKQP